VKIVAGLILPTVLLTLAGLGLLQGLGVAGRGPRSALAASGLAYLAGTSVVMLVGGALLTLGIALTLPLFAVVCGVVGIGGAVLARRRVLGPSAGWLATVRRAPLGYRIATASLLVLAAAYLVVWLLAFTEMPVHDWDGWSIWARKGMILASFDGLPTRFFTDGAYRFMHQDYPLLLPLLESVYFRAMGTFDTAAINAVFWLLLVGFVGALAFVSAAVSRVWAWAACALLVVFAPFVYGALGTAYADVPMGLFLGLGVLLLARWTTSPSRSRDLALACVFLAAAASTKNDALPVVLGALVVASVVVARERRFALLRPLAVGVAGVVVALAPWRIWTGVNGVHGDLPLGRGLHPGYLLERADRIPATVWALIKEIPRQGGWLVPAAVVLVIAALASGVARRAAVFYAVTAVVAFGSVVWSFMISRASLHWQISTAASRVVLGVVFIAIAAIAHLGGAFDSWFASRAFAHSATEEHP
jgi:hypothetical protein